MPALAAAFLTAAATVCPAQDSMSVFARVGDVEKGESSLGNLDDSLSRDWASVTGKFGNTALAIADRHTEHDEDSFLFSSRIHLNADAGPRFWEKKFPGSPQNIAYAWAFVGAERTFTFTEPTSFQMTGFLLDPAKLATGGQLTFYFLEEPRGIALTRHYFRQYGAGFAAITGTLPAGSYSVRAEVTTETREVGPIYMGDALDKSSTGEVDVGVSVNFLKKLTPAFLEWSKGLTSFGKSTSRLATTARNLRTHLERQDIALRSAKRNRPKSFTRDFVVSPIPGGKGKQLIVPVDAARHNEFASAVDTTIRSYKSYQKSHGNLVLRAGGAVEDGYLPAATLLELDTRVPTLSPRFARHLASVSFSRKNRGHTAAEVREIAERYDTAAAYFEKNLPALRKRVDSLHGHHAFITESLDTARRDVMKKLDADTRLTGVENNALNGILNTASVLW